MLKVRVFRAIDDLESCKQFAEGHANVLRDYGITKVTSSKNDWFYNPDVYVAIVETEDGKEVVGGERIHLRNGQFSLPIEEAVSIVEDRIYELVAAYGNNKVTGELCGLWNSKSVAGVGLSMLLTKLGVALAQVIGMDSLFVLCAPYTVEMCQKNGFEIETSIGNVGTFIYPKLDRCYCAYYKGYEKIEHCRYGCEQEIFSFVSSPRGMVIEKGARGNTQVQYDITFAK